MASVGPEAQEAALPFRVYGLEGRANTTDTAVERLRSSADRHGEALGAQAVTLARHEEQLGSQHDTVAALVIAVAALTEKITNVGSRIAWLLVGCTLTVVAALIIFIATQQPPA